MEITFSEVELMHYLADFLKSKTIRELVKDIIKEFESNDENIDESGDEGEKILKMKIAKMEFKKKRGRPRKDKTDKPFYPITIEEEKLNLDI